MTTDLLRYIGVLILAATIDAFELLFTIAATAVGLSVTGIFGWIPVVGQAAASTVDMSGLILGTTADFSISAVFGTGLIVLLVMNGLLPAQEILTAKRLPFILAKLIPILGALPFYTALTVMCILKKSAPALVGAANTTNKEGGASQEEGVEQEPQQSEEAATYAPAANEDLFAQPQTQPRARNVLPLTPRPLPRTPTDGIRPPKVSTGEQRAA